jgi:hypothetical protein
MNATRTRIDGAASFEENKPVCQILILHEDFPAYSRAVEVCRRLMERFASELEFNIKCWNCIELADPNCARHAAKTAGASDIILLSLQTPQTPKAFDQWFESFFIARFRTEGVLALLLNDPNLPPAGQKLAARLERITQRLGMDFLSLPLGDDRLVLGGCPAVPPLQAMR